MGDLKLDRPRTVIDRWYPRSRFLLLSTARGKCGGASWRWLAPVGPRRVSRRYFVSSFLIAFSSTRRFAVVFG